nr:hypothetical protein [Chryseobacterium taichungense]
MAFTSTASAGTSHFTVDGTTLNVDAVNNRVGIGVAAPKSFLQVSTLNGGASVDAGIFSINNCWLACSQSYTARNIVLNNLNSTNSVFASIDFVPSTDPTAPSGSSIQGIDRDGTNNYAGIGFWTRNASSGYGQRMVVKSAGNVGIGTSTPQATLDVNAISSGTSPEGIIAPRLSLSALQGYTYGTNQTGAMVYVNSVSGTPAGQTANVTATGYYYFDGTNWQKVANGASVTDATTAAKGIVQLAGDLSGTAASPSIASSAVTSAKIADGTVANTDLNTGVGGIYKGGGSLSGNTTVVQGSNTLNFTTSATNGFSVAGSTLSVDGSNNRVGIGTTAPITKLDSRQNPGNASPGNGAIGIGETTQTASAAGSGAVRYSTTSGGTIEYSNGTTWNTLTSTVKKSLVYGYLTNGQALTSGGGTFTVTESFDQNNDFTSSTFTVPRTGNYSISLCGLTASSSWNQGEEFSIRVAKNGTTQVVGYWAAPTSTTYYGGSCTSVTISATAGDAITFTYFIGVAGKTIYGADFNRFSIQEL